MKKLTFLIIFIFSFVPQVEAQGKTKRLKATTASATSMEKNKSKLLIHKTIGVSDDKVFVLRKGVQGSFARKNIAEAQILDKQMIARTTAAINLEEYNKQTSLKDAYLKNDSLYVISQFFNKSKLAFYVFAQTLDLNTLESHNNLTMIAESAGKNSNSGFWHNAPTVHFSPDSSRIAIYEKQNGMNMGNFKIYDSHFILQEEIAYPGSDNWSKGADEFVQVSNQGEVAFLERERLYKNNDKSKRSWLGKGRIAFSSAGQIKHVPLLGEMEKDMNVELIEMKYMSSGQLRYIARFVGNSSSGIVTSWYNAMLDETSTKLNYVIGSSNQMDSVSYLNVSSAQNLKKVFEEGAPGSVVNHENGFVLTLQDRSITERTSTTTNSQGQSSSSSSTTYSFKEILILNFDQEGRLTMMESVNYRASGPIPTYFGYSDFVHDGVYYLLMNEMPENIPARKKPIPRDRKVLKLNKSVITLISMDLENTFLAKEMISLQSHVEKLWLKPTIPVYQCDEKAFVLLSTNNKRNIIYGSVTIPIAESMMSLKIK